MLKKALAIGIASLTMAGVGLGFSTLPAAADWHGHPMMGGWSHHHHHHHQICHTVWHHHHKILVCNWF